MSPGCVHAEMSIVSSSITADFPVIAKTVEVKYYAVKTMPGQGAGKVDPL